MSIVAEWLKVCRCSPKAGVGNLLSLIYGQTRFKNSFTYKGVIFEDNAVKNYIRKKYGSIINKYANVSLDGLPVGEGGKKYLWMFWWQGLENAIPLIKGSIESAQRAFPEFTLIVITEDNYKNYIDLPDYIIEKHKKGFITTTELADISRVTLLSKYGGIWSDISMYFLPPVQDFTNFPIFSIKNTDNHVEYLPSKNMWTSFFLYSRNKNHPFFCFARDVFFEYWRDKKTLIDYFLIDYIWWIAYESFPSVRKQIDNIPVTCEHVYDLQRKLNDEFDSEFINEIKKDTWAFKLRRHDVYDLQKNGHPTFYNELFGDFVSIK